MLGHKCNMSDIQASLGLHQLRRLEERLELRDRLWEIYEEGLARVDGILGPAPVNADDRHARNLYCVLLDTATTRMDREEFRDPHSSRRPTRPGNPRAQVQKFLHPRRFHGCFHGGSNGRR